MTSVTTRFASFARVISTLATAATLVACGDSVIGVGDMGNLSYSVYTDYEIASDDIRAVRLVTGHSQSISMSPTEEGSKQVDDESVFTSSLEPAAKLENAGTSVILTVTNPGTYKLSTQLDGELFDTISLNFDRPAAYQLLTWRYDEVTGDYQPMGESFSRVAEGDEVLFLQVPLDTHGDRLVGNTAFETRLEPEGLLTQIHDVMDVWEDGQWLTLSEHYMFIEPGMVTITYRDAPNAVEVSRTFEVLPYGSSLE